MRTKTLPLLGAIALAAASLAVSAPASAHSYLLASTPADGEVLETLPAQFSVTANEPLLDLSGDASGFAIQVVDAAGAYYGDGCLTLADSTLSMGASLGAPGDYRMYWQVISADGHPVSGVISFTWLGNGEASGLAAPPVCGQSDEPEETPEPTTAPTADPEPKPSATAIPIDDNEGMSPDFVSIGLAVLAALGAITVIILGIRALRGMNRNDNDGTPPAS